MFISFIEVGEVANNAEATANCVLVLQLLADDTHEAEEGAFVEETRQVFRVNIEDLDVSIFYVI